MEDVKVGSRWIICACAVCGQRLVGAENEAVLVLRWLGCKKERKLRDAWCG